MEGPEEAIQQFVERELVKESINVEETINLPMTDF